MPNFDAPQSRNEAILQNILGASNVLEAPQSRVEEILLAILNGTAYNDPPQSRKEELLLCILNGTGTSMTPHSRNEAILIAKINGTAYTDAPCSRMEELLIQWLVTYEDVTVSGSTVTFSDAAEGQKLVHCIADINAVQDTSGGDPSPNNICPISGWQSVDVTQCGINLWDEEWEFGGIDDSTGQNINDGVTDYWRSKNYIRVIGGISYNHYTNGYNGRFRHYFYDADKNFIEYTVPTAVDNNVLFTAPSNAVYMRFRYYTALENYQNCINISDTDKNGTYEPYTETEYHAYTGTTHTIPLGNTVYGGTVDAVTGELTVTHGIITLDNTNLDYATDYGANYRGTWNVSGLLHDTFANINSEMMASNCPVNTKPHSASSATEMAVSAVGGAYENIIIVVPNISSLADFKTYMSNNPVTLVYPLNTPTTTTLTATQLQALSGTNTLFADSGDISVTYKRIQA